MEGNITILFTLIRRIYNSIKNNNHINDLENLIITLIYLKNVYSDEKNNIKITTK